MDVYKNNVFFFPVRIGDIMNVNIIQYGMFLSLNYIYWQELVDLFHQLDPYHFTKLVFVLEDLITLILFN